MWLFTVHGFFSCTRSLERPDMMQIRARCRGDLQNLKDRFRLAGQIRETRVADYRWRVICRPETFTRIATELAAEIDYSNFKASIGDDQHDKPLMRVWQAMHDFQTRKHAPIDFEDDHPELPDMPEHDPAPVLGRQPTRRNLGLRYER